MWCLPPVTGGLCFRHKRQTYDGLDVSPLSYTHTHTPPSPMSKTTAPLPSCQDTLGYIKPTPSLIQHGKGIVHTLINKTQHRLWSCGCSSSSGGIILGFTAEFCSTMCTLAHASCQLPRPFMTAFGNPSVRRCDVQAKTAHCAVIGCHLKNNSNPPEDSSNPQLHEATHFTARLIYAQRRKWWLLAAHQRVWRRLQRPNT